VRLQERKVGQPDLLDIPLREDPDASFAFDPPLLSFTIGVAAVVDESRNVSL
jgi:hypothetical protein